MRRDDVLLVLCANRERLRSEFGVKSLTLFGSVARDEARPTSDVDLLVEFDLPTGYFGLVRLQLRLQQTVEGLSVAAISYYIASILHLVFEGLHRQEEHLDPALATALAVPFIVAFVAWNVWRIRKHHTDE